MLFQRRILVLLALVILSIVGARLGHPVCGMWDGPLD
jgi:hypothetical protein